MKSDDIKNAINNIKIDENKKIQILNKIKIENEKKERGINMKSKNKALGSVVAIALVVSGIFIFNDKDKNNEIINEVPSGTSPMVTEKLATIGIIEEINLSGENDDLIIKVVGDKKDGAVFSNVNVNVNMSTNIFNKNNDKLLDIKDLSKGQEIEVYYSGDEYDNQISALRIEILK